MVAESRHQREWTFVPRWTLYGWSSQPEKFLLCARPTPKRIRNLSQLGRTSENGWHIDEYNGRWQHLFAAVVKLIVQSNYGLFVTCIDKELMLVGQIDEAKETVFRQLLTALISLMVVYGCRGSVVGQLYLRNVLCS